MRGPAATALIVHNDATIAALPLILQARGVRGPRRPLGRQPVQPRLRTHLLAAYTAVESSPDKLGRLAVQQLVRRIIDPGQAGPPVVKFIAPELMDRGSTA